MASLAPAMLRKRRIVSLFSVNLHVGKMKLKLGEGKWGMEIIRTHDNKYSKTPCKQNQYKPMTYQNLTVSVKLC